MRRTFLVSILVAFSCLFPVQGGNSFATAAEPQKEPILRLETGMHAGNIKRIGVDAANRWLVTASEDKTVRLWELPSGRLVHVFRPPIGKGNEGKLYAVAISPDGREIACGGWTELDGDSGDTIYLFDRATGRLMKRITGLPNVIFHLVYSPDGRYLAACLAEKNNGIRVYRTNDLSLAGEDRNYGSQSDSADFTHDGRLVTSSQDGYLRLYSRDFRLIAKEKAPGGSQASSVSFSPDGQKIAVGFSDSTKVDVLSGHNLLYLYSPDTVWIDVGNISKVSWSADGDILYGGGRYHDGKGCPVFVWENGGRGKRSSIPGASNTITDIRPLKDGGFIYSAADPVWGAYDRAGNRKLYLTPVIADYRATSNELLISADGTHIQFCYEAWGKSPARFDVNTRRLVSASSQDTSLFPPVTESPALRITSWKNYQPELNGKDLKLDQYEKSRSLSIAPDGGSFLLGADWSLRLFDREGKEKWKVSVPDTAWAVNIAGNGRVAVAAFGDGTIRWYRMTDGKEMLAFFPHNDQKRWVLWTPEGFFDTSKDGAELIGYHLNQGKDKEAQFIGVDKLYDQFYRPDLVMAKFQGKDISEYARAVDVNRLLSTNTLPPAVRMISTSGSTPVRDMTIKGEICNQGGGSGDVTLSLNGMPIVFDAGGRSLQVKGKSAKPACMEFEHMVTLNRGKNHIALMAKNKANTIESNRAEVNITCHSGDKEKPDLYMLVVAVNKYRDGDLRLRYPIADANDLVKSIQAGGKRLFGQVVVKTVYDDAATRAGMERAFRDVGSKTKRDDVFVLFLAGHGITYEKDGNYYFLPVDFRFTGEEAIQKQGISKDDLMRNLAHIQAMKSLLLLDTCNSGSFAEAVASRNIVEKTAVARLSKATGRSTIVASSKDKAALEGYEGHGVFTYTILQGMSGAAKDREGKVTVNGLATYVEETLPKLTYKKWGYEQIPQKSLQGMDFPLALP